MKKCRVLFLSLAVFLSCAEMLPAAGDDDRKQELYSFWKQCDDSLAAFGTEPFTGEKAAASMNALRDFSCQYHLFRNSMYYRLSEMQYGELSESYRQFGNIVSLIDKADSDRILPELSDLIRIRISLQTAMIEYQKGQSAISEKTNMLYALMLIVFSLLTMTVFFVVIIYRRVAARAKKETRMIQEFSLAVMQGQEDERRRISLELHDTVAQNIKYAQMLSEQLVPLLQETGEAHAISEKIHDVDRKCIQDIRTLCYNLTPPDLELGNLNAALSHLVMTFTRDSNLPCSFAIAEDTPLQKLSPDRQLHVFRIVQEALANIVRHAHAHDASVVMRATESGGILIIITDDGCGFDPEHIHEKNEHFGVRGMKERVAALNGTIQFISSAETGTEVRIEFPVKDNM
jgi:signal transduction histidine kinase